MLRVSFSGLRSAKVVALSPNVQVAIVGILEGRRMGQGGAEESTSVLSQYNTAGLKPRSTLVGIGKPNLQSILKSIRSGEKKSHSRFMGSAVVYSHLHDIPVRSILRDDDANLSCIISVCARHPLGTFYKLIDVAVLEFYRLMYFAWVVGKQRLLSPTRVALCYSKMPNAFRVYYDEMNESIALKILQQCKSNAVNNSSNIEQPKVIVAVVPLERFLPVTNLLESQEMLSMTVEDIDNRVASMDQINKDYSTLWLLLYVCIPLAVMYGVVSTAYSTSVGSGQYEKAGGLVFYSWLRDRSRD